MDRGGGRRHGQAGRPRGLGQGRVVAGWWCGMVARRGSRPRTRSLARVNRVSVTARLDQRSWETDSGECRSKLELTADDLAHSLR